MNKKIEATVVQFGDDGITALYLDGLLHKYGNYDDKIEESIDGFLEGARWAGETFIVEKFYIPYEEGVEQIYKAPFTWPDGEFSKKAIKK